MNIYLRHNVRQQLGGLVRESRVRHQTSIDWEDLEGVPRHWTPRAFGVEMKRALWRGIYAKGSHRNYNADASFTPASLSHSHSRTTVPLLSIHLSVCSTLIYSLSHSLSLIPWLVQGHWRECRSSTVCCNPIAFPQWLSFPFGDGRKSVAVPTKRDALAVNHVLFSIAKWSS